MVFMLDFPFLSRLALSTGLNVESGELNDSRSPREPDADLFALGTRLNPVCAEDELVSLCRQDRFCGN